MKFFRSLQLAWRTHSFLIPPVHFQGLTLLSALLMLAAGLYSSYFKAITPTDQNWFREAPSDIYISKSLPALRSEREAQTDALLSSTGDSSKTGLFVLRIGERQIRKEQDLIDALSTLPQGAPVEVEFLDPISRVKGPLWVDYTSLNAENYFVLEGVVIVVEVTQNGASDRAGMRRGDLILQIDNRRFNTPWEAEEIMRSIGPGNTVAYDIMRETEVQRLYVTLAKYGLPVIVILLNLVGIIIWGAGVFVGFKAPDQKAARILSWLFLSLAFVVITNSRAMTLNAVVDTLYLHANVFFNALTATFLLTMWFYFPKHRPDLEPHRFWFVLASAIIPQLLHAVFYFVPTWGLLTEMILFVVAILTALFWFVRGSDDLEYKKIGRQVVAVLALVALVFIFAPKESKDFVLLLIPATLLYSVGRYGLIDLDIRIRRNIQYWLVTIGFVAVLTVLFIYGFRILASLSLQIPAVQLTTGFIEVLAASEAASPITERTLFMIIGMGLFVAFVRLARSGQRFINRKYHRSNYDYRATNNRIHEIVSKNPTVDALNTEITRLLAELMLVRRTGVVVRSGDSGHMYARFHQTDDSTEPEIAFSRIEQLFDYMKESVNEVRIQNIMHPMKPSFIKYGFTLIIPLWSRTRLYGLIFLGEKLSEDTIDQEDIAFLNVIAHQLSVAYDNAFLYEQLASQERLKHELKLARQIQLSSLPQRVPDIEGLDIAGVSIPAHEVGGDYYDLLTDSKKRLTVIVGDVSGKGTSAALYLSKVQGIIRTLNAFEFGPKELFVRTNNFLYSEIERKSFVTAIGGRFDTTTRQLCLARAGHIPVYHFDAITGEVQQHVPRGMGMGMSSAELFEKQMVESHIPLHAGDIFVFASDGVTELKNHRNEEFGEDNLCRLLPGLSTGTASDIRDEILRALRDFNHNGVPNDDQTLVVVKIGVCPS
jgi:serine phosphatase RsbU (regulator of sigma subunit)